MAARIGPCEARRAEKWKSDRAKGHSQKQLIQLAERLIALPSENDGMLLSKFGGFVAAQGDTDGGQPAELAMPGFRKESHREQAFPAPPVRFPVLRCTFP